MKEVIIMVGISGSGKSTFCNSFLKENEHYLRINRDSIRKTFIGENLSDYYDKRSKQSLHDIENMVTYTENWMFNKILNKNYNVIIDNTNLKRNYIERWMDNISGYEVSNYMTLNFRFKFIELNLSMAKNRALYRDNVDLLGLDYEKTLKKYNYIDKQYEDFKNIKQYIETNYKDRIIN